MWVFNNSELNSAAGQHKYTYGEKGVFFLFQEFSEEITWFVIVFSFICKFVETNKQKIENKCKKVWIPETHQMCAK